MPKLETYEAPDRPIRPSAEGIDAFTRSGRYMGQYRRQAAQDARDLGVLQAQSIHEREWPFDVLALEQQMQKDEPRTAIRMGPEDKLGAATHFGRTDNSGNLTAHGQASRGAGALGRASSRMSNYNSGSFGLQQGETTIDTTTGLPIRPYTAKQAAQLNAARDRYIHDPYSGPNGDAARAAQEAYIHPGASSDNFDFTTGQYSTGYAAPPPIPDDPNAPDTIDKIGEALTGGTWQPEAEGLRQWLGTGPGQGAAVEEGREDIQ